MARPSSKRVSSARASARRARLLITRLLGLVHGYPDDGAWVELVRGAAPVRTTLDRTRLARATRWLVTLRGEYRAALYDEIDDAESWLAVVEARLDALKPIVHDGHRPTLDVSAALRWVLVLEPDTLARALAFTPPARPLADQVRLALIAAADRAAADAWVAALAVELVPFAPDLRLARSAVQRACKATKDPKPATLPPLVARLSPLLATQAIEALVSLGPLLAVVAPSLALARATWDEVQRLADDLAARLAIAERPTAALAARADALVSQKLTIEGAEVTGALGELIGHGELPLMAEVAALLPVADRGRFVVHWSALAAHRPNLVAPLIEALGRHLRAGRSIARWEHAGDDEYLHRSPEGAIFTRLADATLDRYFEVLARVADKKLSESTILRFVERDPATALARARALAAVEDGPSFRDDDSVDLAHRLAPDDVPLFVALLVALPYTSATAIEAGAKVLLEAGVPPLGIAELIVQEASTLKRLGDSRTLARRLKLELPPVACAAIDWDPIDSHAGLREELAWLEANDGPAPRIAQLRARLATPAVPTAAQERRHEKKRTRRIAQLTAEAHQAELDGAVDSACRALVGDVPWLGEQRRLVAEVARLPAPYRDLGLELLRRRAGSAPWDLRAHPKNVAFMARARMTNPDLWIDGRTWRHQSLSATLSVDPLVVMRMGEPFGTCLTPGHINFFSAVVNAADINKRVLVVHDARGLMVARMLLAVTASGALVTHRMYGRDEHLPFVERCVRELAADVGLTLVSRAPIEPLLAPRWYDDGPEPLTPSQGAALTTCLRIDPVDVAAVAALFGDVPLEVWLAILLDHAFANTPRVLQAFRGLLLEADLADVDRERAARSFAGIDDHDAVTRLLAPRVFALIGERLAHDHAIEDTLGEVACRVDASRFMRMLKNHVPKWGHIQHHWIAKCLDALGRPKQAEAVRRALSG